MSYIFTNLLNCNNFEQPRKLVLEQNNYCIVITRGRHCCSYYTYYLWIAWDMKLWVNRAYLLIRELVCARKQPELTAKF